MRINRIRIPLLAENADSLARFYKDYFHFEIVLDQVLADGTRKLYLQNENISSVRLDVISRQEFFASTGLVTGVLNLEITELRLLINKLKAEQNLVINYSEYPFAAFCEVLDPEKNRLSLYEFFVAE
jgi:hypothetical protein